LDTHTTGNVGNQTPTTEEILDGLNDLLQLDHDAVGAYDIAIERLKDRDHADQIAGFRRDHERHIRELNELITEFGGTPTNEPHATGPFKQALQGLGALAGDKGILLSWRTNELQVRTKYDAYASKAVFWPDHVKRLIDRNALDEERHYRWVSDVLAAMGIGSGEGKEVDLVDTMREKANVRRMGDTGPGLGETVRERVAGGLESAANRIGYLVDQDQTGSGRMAGVADRVSGGMESTARYVREGNLDDLRGGFEERVRRSPGQTLLVAALAGFVVGRLLR
jgi:rubrerythrin